MVRKLAALSLGALALAACSDAPTTLTPRMETATPVAVGPWGVRVDGGALRNGTRVTRLPSRTRRSKRLLAH